MPAFIDLTGQKFGRWVALKRVKVSSKPKITHWLCRCTCGSEHIVQAGHLRSGLSISCGCVRPGAVKYPVKDKRTYTSWRAMKDRCSNPNNKDWNHYGGKGVRVAREWKRDFNAFLRDLGPRPPGTTLDRIDCDGNYFPGNCRWATSEEQNNNSSNVRWITFQGETRTLTAWSEILEIHVSSLIQRLQKYPKSVALTKKRKSRDEC